MQHQQILPSFDKLEIAGTQFADDPLLSEIVAELVQLRVGLAVHSTRRENAHFAGTDPRQFADGRQMKIVIEPIVVDE